MSIVVVDGCGCCGGTYCSCSANTASMYASFYVRVSNRDSACVRVVPICAAGLWNWCIASLSSIAAGRGDYIAMVVFRLHNHRPRTGMVSHRLLQAHYLVRGAKYGSSLRSMNNALVGHLHRAHTAVRSITYCFGGKQSS